MQQYQSHKQVRAVKIQDFISIPERNFMVLVCSDNFNYARYITEHVLTQTLSDRNCIIIDLVDDDSPAETVAVVVTHGWAEKFEPHTGGYFVMYQDGYSSFSPQKAFEEGYTPINPTPIYAPAGNEDINLEDLQPGAFIQVKSNDHVSMVLEGEAHFNEYPPHEVVSYDDLTDVPFDDEDIPSLLDGCKKDDLPTKVTKSHLESLITNEQYLRVPNSTMTLCILTLSNGHISIGYDGCVAPDEFDEQSGRVFAREAALEKLWPLEGYLLRNRRFEAIG